MEVTYELTQRDFYESLIAHRNRLVILKWARRLMVSFLFLLAAAGLVLLAVRPSSKTFTDLVPLFILAVVWAVFIWGWPWWAARGQFLKQPAAHGLKTVLIDETGIHWRWNWSSSDLEWKNYIRCLEAKNQFLLYPSPAHFNIVPKRAFTPEQMAEFRTLIAQNIPHGR